LFSSARLARFFRGGRAGVHSHGKRPEGNRPYHRAMSLGMGILALGAVAVLGVSLVPGDNIAGDIRARSPHTDYTRYISNSLQGQFAESQPGLKIVYLDSDLVNIRTALYAGDATLGDRKKQVELAIKEQLPGAQFSDRVLRSIDSYLADHTASSMPFDGEEKKPDGTKISKRSCIIVPNGPNLSARYVASEIMGVEADRLHTIGDAPGRIDLTMEVFRRYVDYHETTHCMDMRFLAEEMKYDDDVFKGSWYRHRAEALADVNAVLLLAREGEFSIGGKLADMRAVGSSENGRYTPFTDPEDWTHYGAEVYFTTKATRAAAAWAKEAGPARLSRMSVRQLLDQAYKITEANAMSEAEFQYLHRYFMGDVKPLSAEARASADRQAKALDDSLAYFVSQAGGARAKMINNPQMSLGNRADAAARMKGGHFVDLGGRLAVAPSAEPRGAIPDLVALVNKYAGLLPDDRQALAKSVAYVKDGTRRGVYELNGAYNVNSFALDRLDRSLAAPKPKEPAAPVKDPFADDTGTGVKGRGVPLDPAVTQDRPELPGLKDNAPPTKWEPVLPDIRR
jgi:hypothetical protein